MKLRSMQAWMQGRSKVWPEGTTTGLAIRREEMGQKNTDGGGCGGGSGGGDGGGGWGFLEEEEKAEE